jgi:hypothetical protein
MQQSVSLQQHQQKHSSLQLLSANSQAALLMQSLLKLK